MEVNSTIIQSNNNNDTSFVGQVLKRVIYSDQAVNTALVFCIIFIVLGVLGNLCTIAAILKSRKLRNAPTSVFVVSLSVADLIFCSFNLPLTAVRYYNQKWVLGEALCKLFPFFFYLNVAASLFNMVAVTLNRYIMIAHYHRYDRLYRKTTIALMIAFCWAVPVAMLLPTLAEVWGRFGYYESTFSCTILKHKGLSPKKFLFIVGFFFPCSIIIVSYLRIFCVVRSSRRNLNGYDKTSTTTSVNGNGNSSSVESDKKNNRKSSSKSNAGGHQIDEMALTYTVLVIFCAFLLCYLPLMIVNVFDDNEKFPMAHVLASVLAWASAVVNPFVYGLMSRRYREAYANLIRWPCCCTKGGRWTPGGSSQETTNSSTTRHDSMETSIVYSVNNGNTVMTPVGTSTPSKS